ncbi:MAG TPA: trigger factor [Gammaproteobacteria bacterium]|nr:trigger factor [Gammaproteobacteria bacterium]
MQVSVESTGTLGRKITVQVPSEQIDSAVDKKLQDLSRSVKLDGFRPGKVPMKVVRQKFSGQVRQEVMGEMVQSTLYEAIDQENLKPAEGPKVENVDMEPGKTMEYSATFEVYPEVKLESLDGKEVEKIVVKVEDSDVDKMFEKLQAQHVDWEKVDRPAKEGDQLLITFEGRIDGEPFEGGKTDQDFPLVLGSGSMIPGFEDQLKAVKTGDKKTIEVTFPEDYQAADLAGKKAEFDVEVNLVNKPVLPELDDEFATLFGVADGLDAFRKEVRANMEREVDSRIKSWLKTAIMDLLIELHELELPQALVEEEAENLMKQARKNRPEMPVDVDLPKEMFQAQAAKRVALGLLVSELIQANKVEVDKGKVVEMLNEISGTYEKPEEVVKVYGENPQMMQSLEGFVLEDQVVELLSKQVTIKEKSMTFDDVMNKNTSE